jgi:hypothetical protein
MLQILMDPAQFPKFAAKTTAKVIRAFKETNRPAFLAHFENSIYDWKSVIPTGKPAWPACVWPGSIPPS